MAVRLSAVGSAFLPGRCCRQFILETEVPWVQVFRRAADIERLTVSPFPTADGEGENRKSERNRCTDCAPIPNWRSDPQAAPSAGRIQDSIQDLGGPDSHAGNCGRTESRLGLRIGVLH